MEIFLGAVDTDVLYNGQTARPSQRTTLDGALILASRSEVKRGEWKQFENGPFKIQQMGSVAYKLALVSAGLADVYFHFDAQERVGRRGGSGPGAGAGRFVSTLEKTDLTANRRDPLLSGLLASGPFLKDKLLSLWWNHISGWPNRLASFSRPCFSQNHSAETTGNHGCGTDLPSSCCHRR
jgi:fructose-1,6-bisphosphatase/inositol monophosphatase family enzyme